MLKGEGFLTYIASYHQGASNMFWLHFRSPLMLSIYWKSLKCPNASPHYSLFTEPFTETRLIWQTLCCGHPQIIPLMSDFCGISKLQGKQRDRLYKPKLSANIYPALVFPSHLPILQRLYLINSGLQAEMLCCWQSERNLLSDTGDDERKEEYGTWGMRERNRLQQRGGEEEQEGERESLHTPSVHQRCGCAACIHDALSAWLFLMGRSLEYKWSYFPSPVYWDLPYVLCRLHMSEQHVCRWHRAPQHVLWCCWTLLLCLFGTDKRAWRIL